MRCIVKTVLVLTLYGMHTRARKEYVIEHNDVYVCDDGVQRHARRKKEKRERERAKKRVKENTRCQQRKTRKTRVK